MIDCMGDRRQNQTRSTSLVWRPRITRYEYDAESVEKQVRERSIPNRSLKRWAERNRELPAGFWDKDEDPFKPAD